MKDQYIYVAFAHTRARDFTTISSESNVQSRIADTASAWAKNHMMDRTMRRKAMFNVNDNCLSKSTPLQYHTIP